VLVQCGVCAATSVAKKSDVRLVHEKAFRDLGSGFGIKQN